MPIFIWIIAIVGVAIFAAAGYWFIWSARPSNFPEFPRLLHIIGSILSILAGIAIAVGSMYWLYGTAPGQRELKSFASETTGGLPRVVTVYDLEGDVIGSYEGTFDIQTDNTRVFFDLPQEDGSTKRVQIYNATVIVEEK